MDNIISDIAQILDSVGMPSAMGAYLEAPPDHYAVIEPGHDSFQGFADNLPTIDIQRARVTVSVKSDYSDWRVRITGALLFQCFKFLDRAYIGYDGDTEYFAFSVDVEKSYSISPYRAYAAETLEQFKKGS